MRLMLIGTDRMVFTPGSAVRTRLVRFGGGHTEQLDSVVFSTRAHGIKSPQELAPKVRAFPTRSISRWLYIWDALRVSRTLPKPDIISAQDPFECGLAAYLIARYFGVNFVVGVHTDFLSPHFKRASVLNRIRLLIARFVIPRASGCYTVSDAILQQVKAQYPRTGKLDVLPIYVDTDRFSRIVREPHPRFPIDILWVGRMEEEKNPHLALESLVEARRQGFDLGLTFVGEGSLLDGLKARALAAGVSDAVEFIGAVKDVVPYYARADLMLVTSAYEGYGMAIIEALAAQVPVISTDVGIAAEAGAIIAPFDTKQYVQTLIDWLEGPRDRGVLQLHMYKDEEDYFDRVERFHTSLIGQNSAA